MQDFVDKTSQELNFTIVVALEKQTRLATKKKNGLNHRRPTKTIKKKYITRTFIEVILNFLFLKKKILI